MDTSEEYIETKDRNSVCDVVPEGGFGRWGISEYCLYCPASEECAKLSKKLGMNKQN